MLKAAAVVCTAMDCPACGSNITIEVGPERPLSTSVVDAQLAAPEAEQIEIARTCWECGWHEERTVHIDSIETTEGDAHAVERTELIADITRKAEAIESITMLEHVLAEVGRQQRLEANEPRAPDTTPDEEHDS